jgi:hypothetical protein
MAYLLTCNIQLESLNSFNFASQLGINSSFKNLTDTATIQFPRNTKLIGGELRSFLKSGKKARLEFGYDGNHFHQYQGYIRAVKPETPFQVELEDATWLLKQTSFSASYNQVSLTQLLQEMLTPLNISFIAPQTLALGKIRIEKTSIAKVLQHLKDNYGLFSFFVKNILYVGTPYLSGFQYADQSPVIFDFQQNIISSNLEYSDQNDRKIKIEAIGIQANNQTIKTTIGDPDGETHTLHYYQINTESELKQHAEADYQRLNVSGYKGDFLAFGLPAVTHGMQARIQDSQFPERGGVYKIDSVESTFDTQGIRQKIELGIKISNT